MGWGFNKGYYGSSSLGYGIDGSLEWALFQRRDDYSIFRLFNSSQKFIKFSSRHYQIFLVFINNTLSHFIIITISFYFSFSTSFITILIPLTEFIWSCSGTQLFRNVSISQSQSSRFRKFTAWEKLSWLIVRDIFQCKWSRLSMPTW